MINKSSTKQKRMCDGKKTASSTNGVEKTGQHYVKE